MLTQGEVDGTAESLAPSVTPFSDVLGTLVLLEGWRRAFLWKDASW
jgi:hypothetical protein